MKVFLLIIAIALLIACSLESCDVDEAKKCTISMLKSLGYPDSANGLPGNSSVFIDFMRQQIVQKGLDYLILQCTASQILRNFCFVSSDYYDCITVAGFQAMGFSGADSLTYASYAAVLDSNCGLEYDDLYKNYDCIHKIYSSESYGATADQCKATFRSNVAGDKDKTCQFAEIYMTCLVTPFTSGCGAVAGGAVCNSTLAGMLVDQPACSSTLSCSTAL